MHPPSLPVVALQPPCPPVQPDGEEVPGPPLPPLLQAAAVAHLTALSAPSGHDHLQQEPGQRGRERDRTPGTGLILIHINLLEISVYFQALGFFFTLKVNHPEVVRPFNEFKGMPLLITNDFLSPNATTLVSIRSIRHHLLFRLSSRFTFNKQIISY